MEIQAVQLPQQIRYGISYWMEEVLRQLDKASLDLAPDPVHDLRVAIRRCRSLGSGFRSIDPDPAWRRMRAAAKAVFVPLGQLRDVHVLADWVKKIGPTDVSTTVHFIDFLTEEEARLKAQAARALRIFDRKQWQLWASHLSTRTKDLVPGSAPFQYLALEHWQAALNLHHQALRNRSKVSFHRLRIGIKKFRYLAENFLPAHHQRWGQDLKELQDALGDIHDLDVLWATLVRGRHLTDSAIRAQWQSRIGAVRRSRMDAYRDKMVGPNSLWRKWRSELPSGPEQDAALLARFRAFVRLLKAEPEHAERVARLSLQLYDGLCSCGIFLSRDTMPRLLLQTAALMHEVGRTKTGKGHHKASARMIAKMNPPLGWADMHLQVAALVARYHRGAIPWLKHKRFSRLSKPTQQLTRELAGVLRVADSLARFRDGAVKDIAVSKTPEVLVVRADGFNPDEPLSEKVSGARHLLEITAGLPCIIRGSTPWRSAKVS